MVQLSKLDSLLEARRILRKLKVNSDKNNTEFNSLEKLAAQKGVVKKERILGEIRERSSKILKESQQNKKLSEHVKVLLATHLRTKERLCNKLIRHAELIASSNTELTDRANLFLSKLPVQPNQKHISQVIKQIMSKFPASKFAILAHVSQSNFGELGLLTFRNKLTDKKMHCAIIADNNETKLKTFIGEITAHEITPSNFVPFKSTGNAYSIIFDIMKKDNFL